MKEYRIVATLDTEHGYDGKKYHYEAISCRWGGTIHKIVTSDYGKAKRQLEIAKRECPKFDKKTEEAFEKNPRDYIKYKHTNIRIESREVSEWQ